MSDKIQDAVKSKYGAVAVSNLSTDHDGVRAVAEAFGYTTEELRSIPAEANMGLSCGNPVATAHLKEGETVVDLGSGGGLDVFLAARQVGPTGRAIGIDMTPQMIELANRNLAKTRYENVEFHLATIDKLPLEDASVDVVVSNCVINLAPDKPAVFREIARVLKPGGRLAVSDIALKKPLPAELGNDIMAYVGCIAGAIPIEEYRAGLAAAGFTGVEVVDSKADLNAYAKVENQSGCCSPAMADESAANAEACCAPAPAASDACCEPLAAKAAAGEPCCEPVVTQIAGRVKKAAESCCEPAAPTTDENIHERLKSLFEKYDVNDYAASVKVFAVR